MMLPVLAPGHNSLKLTTFGDFEGFCRLASSPWKGESCRLVDHQQAAFADVSWRPLRHARRSSSRLQANYCAPPVQAPREVIAFDQHSTCSATTHVLSEAASCCSQQSNSIIHGMDSISMGMKQRHNARPTSTSSACSPVSLHSRRRDDNDRDI